MGYETLCSKDSKEKSVPVRNVWCKSMWPVKSDAMFLSIIIPVYKVEPYLRECLDSVAASPLDCWEAILVDDGSPDGCPQLCDEYARRNHRFRVIHQKNGGVAAARNAGLDAAQGEWCWFVDADDVVDMRYVEDMMKWLRSHDGADMAMFDLQTFRDGETLDISARAVSPMVVAEMADIEEFMFRHVCYHYQCLWYRRRWTGDNQQCDADENLRRATMRALRFTAGLSVGADLEFQYKFLTLCRRPFKFAMTLYYDRQRESLAMRDLAYSRKAVEDLSAVLHNLAAWSRERDVRPTYSYNFRIRELLQSLLRSASLASADAGFDVSAFQEDVRAIVREYRALGFPFVRHPKVLLATWSVKTCLMFNRILKR